MSRRTVLVLLPAIALVVVGVAGAEGPRLAGTVGPGFSITLADPSGSTVSHLAATGPYELAVEDRSEEHNFHLTGPGVDATTLVSDVGATTFQLMLQDGTYNFICDVHPLQMRGSFTVGAAQPPAPPPPPPPPAALPRVVVTVAGGKLALRVAGKAVKQVKAGRYVLEARDRSAAHNVHLLGAGVNRKTTVPFTGVKRWTVTLRKGTLVFRSDPQATTLRGTLTVA
jgi:plastocyanin